MSNHIDLLKKLKTLADRGLDGERVNAQMMLARLLKKHNMTIDELETNDKKHYPFKLPKDKNKQELVMQIITSVVDVKYYKKIKPYRIGVEMNKSQYIECLAKIEFYIKHYEKELKIFNRAFYTVNNIWPVKPSKYFSKITEEEFKELTKANKMAIGLDNNVFYKQINRGDPV